mmetsp:Transcript_4267/g.12206  ORF Transcript_4267/g.12206 Transcript_4267/m.12206 type:complete len:247 (+) Transcript_4267:120-860(+)|eukprot:CAMPEP_0113669244 /NCGR_PEP_ID=MMETSP0038_2-20120614/4464_1 /TAXON_ID=2898 /ORGANISM="Cryptomonas paramecium" /LENGTH=246 /DNA_ID=CAMNT_0000585109 /DNA_START=97 /DNA_END=837 /DNA_ORIENTATION=- /assembly_acc=CAM_ASM_000170
MAIDLQTDVNSRGFETEGIHGIGVWKPRSTHSSTSSLLKYEQCLLSAESVCTNRFGIEIDPDQLRITLEYFLQAPSHRKDAEAGFWHKGSACCAPKNFNFADLLRRLAEQLLPLRTIVQRQLRAVVRKSELTQDVSEAVCINDEIGCFQIRPLLRVLGTRSGLCTKSVPIVPAERASMMLETRKYEADVVRMAAWNNGHVRILDVHQWMIEKPSDQLLELELIPSIKAGMDVFANELENLEQTGQA